MLKDYFFGFQLFLDFFEITAIVILAFLYLKLVLSKKNNQQLSKIEYLCKNMESLVEQNEKSAGSIQNNIDEFKKEYDKNIAEIEKKMLALDNIINKLEQNEKVGSKMQDGDKYTKIRKLIRDGHTVDSIANMLKISKGEVELVLSIIKTSGSA